MGKDPMMCVIIPSLCKLICDVQIGVYIISSFNKADGFEANLVPGTTHMGVTKFIFHVKEVPALFIPTRNGSITSKILAEVLNIVRLSNSRF